MNRQTNMSRIGIRFSAPFPATEAVPEEVAAVPAAGRSTNGLLIDRSRRRGGAGGGRVATGTGDVKGDTNSVARSRNKWSWSGSGGDVSRSRSRRPTVNNWIFLPSIIFTCLIGRSRSNSLESAFRVGFPSRLLVVFLPTLNYTNTLPHIHSTLGDRLSGLNAVVAPEAYPCPVIRLTISVRSRWS